MKLLVRAAILVIVAALVYSTLSPIGMRPHLMEADAERFSAYLLLGVAAAVGFPRSPGIVIALTVPFPIVLELLQIIDPSRHGRLADAIWKVLGGLVGVFLVRLVFAAFRYSTRSS